MRAIMRRAAARRRLAALLRRKPFGRVTTPLGPARLAPEETGAPALRPFAWRKGDAQ
jgi:hypothetical protein